jgi:hypothetical protein
MNGDFIRAANRAVQPDRCRRVAPQVTSKASNVNGTTSRP